MRRSRVVRLALGLALLGCLAPIEAAATAAVKGPPAAPHTFSVPGRMRALSCPSASVCLGITQVAKASRWGVIRITHKGAKSHTTLAKKSFTLVAISCPSRMGCEALAQSSTSGADVLLPVGFDGGIGKPRRLGAAATDGLTTVACYAAATTCTLVGEESNVISVVTTDGTTTTTHRLTLAANVLGLSIGALACPTATQCYAVGSIDTAGKVRGLIEPVLNGVPGTPIDVASASNLGLLGIACLTATRCFAVGDGTRAFIYGLTSGTVTHAAKLARAVVLYGIACQGAHSCDAVGSEKGTRGVVVPISDGKHAKLQATHVTPAYGSEGGATDPIAGFDGGIEIAGVDAAQTTKTIISSS
jgi:hypothetical protein